jgi:hypothetical protein
MTQKFLICFPQGGINDMWSVMQQTINYCEREDRILVLDTTKNWFRDDWQAYFSILSPVVYKGVTPELITNLLKQDVFPSELQGKTHEELNHVIWVTEGHMSINGIHVSSPLHLSYKESVIVYAYCAMFRDIMQVFPKLQFTEEILTEFRRRRSMLPEKYISVHIRNTDNKSNVDEFIYNNRHILEKAPLFVASDNLNSIQRCKLEFNNVYSFSTIPDLGGENIHESSLSQKLRTTAEETRKWNSDAILDFLLLTQGEIILCSNYYSGFSMSAKRLQEAYSKNEIQPFY